MKISMFKTKITNLSKYPQTRNRMEWFQSEISRKDISYEEDPLQVLTLNLYLK